MSMMSILEHVLQIVGSKSIFNRFIRQKSNLKDDAFLDFKPVQVLKVFTKMIILIF